MKTFATMLVVSALVFGNTLLAEAQDIIGMYADQTGTANTIVVDINTPFDVYVLLTDPSNASDLLAWDCFISYPDISIGGNVYVESWTIAGGFANVVVEPEFQAIITVDPLPNDDIMLLLSARVHVTTMDEACVYIDGSTLDPLGTGQPAYVPEDWDEDPGNIVGMTQSSGGPDVPVFIINPGTSPVNPETWSRVKALFR